MRDIYQIVIAFYLFMLCINLGFYFVGGALGIPGISSYSTNFNTLNSTYNSQAQSYAQGGGFNTALIFGDFGKGITDFMSIISGKYVLDTMTNIGMPDSLVLPMQVIVGFMAVVSLIYLVSGRQ